MDHSASTPPPGARSEDYGASVSDKRQATHHLEQGNSLCEQGKFEAAIEEFRHALILDSRSAQARFNLAVALLYIGHADEAVREFRSVLSFHPEYFQAHAALGRIFLQQSRFPEAVMEFRAALAIEPACADEGLLVGLGIAHTACGEYELAVGELKAALEKNPGSPLTLYHLARTYALSSEVKPALDSLRKALLLRKDLLQHAERAAEFDSIRQDPRYQSLVKIFG